MRQAANRKQAMMNQWLNPMLLLLLILLFAATTVVYYTTQQEPAAEPTLADVVITKIAAASQSTRYHMRIEESGPGYSLKFAGQMADDKLYGKLVDYNIEVFSVAEKYFIKEASAKDWQEVSTASLDALPALIRNPFVLLETLLTDNELVIEEGKKRTVGNVVCQTYQMEVRPPDLQLLTQFDKEAALDKLQLYLWLAEEGDFMHRMALIMAVTVEGEQIEINRVYELQQTESDLPEGLPETKSDLKPI